MYQVNFSEQSMKELNQLDITKQMEIAEIISSITKEQLAHPNEALRSFHRDNTVYYRVRANDFRIYFELIDDQLFTHYILHKKYFSRFYLPY